MQYVCVESFGSYFVPDWLPSTAQWVLSTLIGAGAAYAAIKVKLANHEVRIRAIEQELGTRETGIRGALHKLPSEFQKLDTRIAVLEDRDER